MSDFKIYHGGYELDVTIDDDSIARIVKVCSQNDQMFLLTQANDLYFGLINYDLKKLHLNLIRTNISDIACSDDSIYVCDLDGYVQACPLMAVGFDKYWNDIIIDGSKKTKIERLFDADTKLAESERIRISRIVCNNDGILFITWYHELYAMGNFGEICQSDEPIRISQFTDHEVIDVAAGRHFVVVLSRRKVTARKLPFSPGGRNFLFNPSIRAATSTQSLNTNLFNSHYYYGSRTSILREEASALCDNDLSSLSVDENSVLDPSGDLSFISPNSMMTPVRLSTSKSLNVVDTENTLSVSSQVDMEQEIGKLQKIGKTLIETYVWTFGTVNNGHLGTGDHIVRKYAMQIFNLCEQGVYKLCCGDEHTAALTLDGRLYMWGSNSKSQIAANLLENEDCSTPRRFYKTEQNVLDVQCGQLNTFIMTNNLEKYEFGQNVFFPCIQVHAVDETSTSNESSDNLFLANKQLLVLGNNFQKLKFEKYLKFEQQFLQNILQKVAPHLPKFAQTMHRNMVKHPTIYKQLFHQYKIIAELTAVNTRSLLLYARDCHPMEEMIFIKYHQELIHIIRLYTKHYCEIICSNDFHATCQNILSSDEFIAKFSTPMQHIFNYCDFLCDLLALEIKETYEFLKVTYERWVSFKNDVSTMLDSAEQTVSFWNNYPKNFPNTLQIPERRLVLDSKEFPLKLLQSNRFSNNWFILFNDIFCHSTGSSASLKQFPLKTIWISNIADKEASSSTATMPKKYLFKIIAPEHQLMVAAQSHEIKMKWLKEFERYIRAALGIADTKIVPMYRSISYTFSDKHKSYPKCNYTGRWYTGKMHGIGHLDYPDGKAFTGQFELDVINGYGKFVVPNMSSYEGQFIDGKYHGYGMLEMYHLNAVYEGSFKAGLQHGHGVLTNDQKTYIGEFSNGYQHGYGVLDEAISGDKYMGMFADDKRSGYGFCITAEGKYFEGNFVDNELSGQGLAIFTDGSYYEGELITYGPNGRGSLYLPREMEVNREHTVDFHDKNIQIIGNVLTGNLSGIWDNVKVNNGNFALNQQFHKHSKLFGAAPFDCDRKWQSLFMIWNQEVFNKNIDEVNDIREIWQRVTQYTRNSKQMELLKTTISTTVFSHENKIAFDQFSHESPYDDNLSDLGDSSSIKRNKLKYHSLSKITGENFKRNILTMDRIKSVSNEFLNHTANHTYNGDCDPFDAGDADDGKNPFMMTTKNPVPYFGITKLDKTDLQMIRDYLTKAFKSQHHPLGVLNARVTYCFYTSYGCWKVKPIALLCAHAIREWESISKRIYDIIRKLFPTLPSEYENLEDDFISHRSLLYPILLSEGIYSTLFVLFANKCSQRDELYRQKVTICEKKTDLELMNYFKIGSIYLPMLKHNEFEQAIISLRQVKEKFCPREMLKLIEMTFKHVEKSAEAASNLQNVIKSKSTDLDADDTGADEHAIEEKTDENEVEGRTENDEATANCKSPASAETKNSAMPQVHTLVLNADNMMPLTIFLLLRAAIPHLGTEILLLEDLMGNDFEYLMNGYAGYCFTTVKAAFQHIINDSFL